MALGSDGIGMHGVLFDFENTHPVCRIKQNEF
jgi:hypothetical protein